MAKRRCKSSGRKASKSSSAPRVVDLQAKVDEVMRRQQQTREAAAEQTVVGLDGGNADNNLAPGQIVLRVVGWTAWVVAAWFLASLIISVLIVFLRSRVGYNALADTIGSAAMQVALLVIMLALTVNIPYRLGQNKLLTPAKRRAVKMRLLGIGRLPNRDDFLPWLVAIVAYYLLAFAITLIAGLFLPESVISQQQDTGFVAGGWASAAAIVLILAVLTPVFEELIFRGFLLGKVQQLTGFWPAAVIVSLLFAVAHGQINVGLVTFVLSMIACYTRHRTGAVWAGIGLHMVVNLIASSLVFIAPLMA